MVADLRPLLRNWYIVAPLIGVQRYRPMARALYNRVLRLRLRDGRRIDCRVSEFYAFLEVFVHRDYDMPELAWDCVRTIIDIGANVGMATLWLAQRAPIARIVAVEPDPDALLLLHVNVRRNGLHDRVSVVPAAVGDRRGHGQVVRSCGSTALTRVQPGVTNADVEVWPLQDLVDLAGGRVDLLKIDCEGAEYDAFGGARPAALRCIGAIVGEYHIAEGRGPDDLVRLLTAAGFEVDTLPSHAGAAAGRFRSRRIDRE